MKSLDSLKSRWGFQQVTLLTFTMIQMLMPPYTSKSSHHRWLKVDRVTPIWHYSSHGWK